MVDEIEEIERQILVALQAARLAYEKVLHEYNMDVSNFPFKFTVFETDSDSKFRAGIKVLELDDREKGW